MLCYVMLCYVLLSYTVLCCVMLCYDVLCCVMLCCVMSCYVILYYVMLCYVVLCCVMLCLNPGDSRAKSFYRGQSCCRACGASILVFSWSLFSSNSASGRILNFLFSLWPTGARGRQKGAIQIAFFGACARKF